MSSFLAATVCPKRLVGILGIALAGILNAGTAEYKIRIERDVVGAMRDGVRLKADVYRPDAEGSFPVVLGRAPYGKNRVPTSIIETHAKRGYIVVIQDIRGRGESEGIFEPFFDDDKDGFDSVEWAAGLPQSNGKVAMFLGSFGASPQIFAASAAPPHLVTIFAVHPAIGFGSHHIFFEGGAFRQLWAESWTAGWLASDGYSRTLRRLGAEGSYLAGIMRELPVGDFMERIFREALRQGGGGYFREWVRHEPGDNYWERVNVANKVGSIKVPGCYVAGWYDVFGPATVETGAAVLRAAGSDLARAKSQLIIGPWTHGGPTGDVDFGPSPRFDIEAYQSQWFDYWLKGEANGVPSQPPVRVFVTGENRWVDSSSWPPSPATPYQLYLSSDHSAQSASGDGRLAEAKGDAGRANRGRDLLEADPANPVPTKGGKLCCNKAYPPGAFFQASIEDRRDVLVYSTEPLKHKVIITGEPVLSLFISSDTPDIDVVAKLTDVSTDGKSVNVADGVRRLRYRNGFARPEPLVAGKVYKVDILLGPAMHAFQVGHRIRLQIAGSDFPNYSVNLNSGERLVDAVRPRVAHTTVFHDTERPSVLQLHRIAERKE